MKMSHRYRLTVSYDGTDFHGWQRQPLDDQTRAALARGSARALEGPPGRDGRAELRTVQGVVEHAVRDLLREPDVSLIGASRTDSGVHAQGQVAAFTTRPLAEKGVGWPAERGAGVLVKALNAKLPRDVLVREAAVVRDDFDPISDAQSKEYTYTIATGPDRPLWQRRYVFHTWYALDAARIDEAAHALVGEHDFAGFAQIDHGRATTVRTIHACSVEPVRASEPGLWSDPAPAVRIRVSGSGFLYNMVRIIAGTLMEVGRGAMEVESVREVLVRADRRLAGPTLPPQGLRLEWIRHREDDAFA